MDVPLITTDMIARYQELMKQKKEIDNEMDHLKKIFHVYFDRLVGVNQKGEIIHEGMKLQRQIRKTEKYNETSTVQKLEALCLHDLIQNIKKPDTEKISAAIALGLLKEADLHECKEISYAKVISVKDI